MNEVKVIKRYQNRKLYDTHQSCYVTLEEISQMIKNGDDLRVIDNKTKNDITQATLTQLLYETERKAANPVPVELLKDIIRDLTPQEYDYVPDGGDPLVKQEDYDIVEVIPVSDPNSSTMAQRIMQYQAVIQLAQGAPQIYNLPVLHRQMIEVLGIKNADKLVPIENSKLFYEAAKAHHVPTRLLELPNGGHGLNGYKGPSCDAWQKESLIWLKETIGF